MGNSTIPDDTFVNAIRDLVKPNTTQYKVGRKDIFVTGDHDHVIYEDPNEPKPEALGVSSLQAVADYVLGGVAKTDIIVHVVSPTSVDVISPVVGDLRNKLTFLSASAIIPEVRFNQFLAPDDFIIALLANYLPTDERNAVLSIVADIKSGVEAAISDNGVSQTVVTRRGIQRTGEAERIQNMFVLTPYRTFVEVEQPHSPFILRVKDEKGPNDTITAKAGLFLADGEAWRIAAITAIAQWLQRAINGVNGPIQIASDSEKDSHTDWAPTIILS